MHFLVADFYSFGSALSLCLVCRIQRKKQYLIKYIAQELRKSVCITHWIMFSICLIVDLFTSFADDIVTIHLYICLTFYTYRKKKILNLNEGIKSDTHRKKSSHYNAHNVFLFNVRSGLMYIEQF